MEWKESLPAIEAILFVSGDSLEITQLAKALELTDIEISLALNLLEAEMTRQKRGIRLKRYGDHIRLETCPEFMPYIQKLLQPVQNQTLTQTALETLAVIAYKQPVTKAEIEAIRGVKCDYSIQLLLMRGLVEEVGRKDAVGKPFLYGTTDTFLEHFGISDIRELPTPLSQPSDVENSQELIP